MAAQRHPAAAEHIGRRTGGRGAAVRALVRRATNGSRRRHQAAKAMPADVRLQRPAPVFRTRARFFAPGFGIVAHPAQRRQSLTHSLIFAAIVAVQQFKRHFGPFQNQTARATASPATLPPSTPTCWPSDPAPESRPALPAQTTPFDEQAPGDASETSPSHSYPSPTRTRGSCSPRRCCRRSSADRHDCSAHTSSCLAAGDTSDPPCRNAQPRQDSHDT